MISSDAGSPMCSPEVELCAREIVKLSRSKHGGWHTEIIEQVMVRHGIAKRFRPDVLDALGANWQLGARDAGRKPEGSDAV